MKIQNFKKCALAFALAVGFVIIPGLSDLSAVQAQGDWRYRQDRRDDRWDNRRDRWDRRDNRNGSYGYNSRDEQKGFRDGLDRGQEDARDRRSFNPNNSSHFRKGNYSYREGFRRGYAQGYRQNNYFRRW
ncbi:MAG: hypothetical protein ABI977_27960 [Acidobacteriota bacterium]